MELVHYSEWWGVGAKSTLCKAFLVGKNLHYGNAQNESQIFGGKKLSILLNVQNECLCRILGEKLTGKFNGCFLGKTSL